MPSACLPPSRNVFYHTRNTHALRVPDYSFLLIHVLGQISSFQKGRPPYLKQLFIPDPLFLMGLPSKLHTPFATLCNYSSPLFVVFISSPELKFQDSSQPVCQVLCCVVRLYTTGIQKILVKSIKVLISSFNKCSLKV